MGEPWDLLGWGSTGGSSQKQGVKAGGCAGRLSEGPDFRPALLSPHCCSLLLLPAAALSWLQEAGSAAHRTCHLPQLPLRRRRLLASPATAAPRFANVPAWPLLTATVSNSHHTTAALQCFSGRARGVSSPSNAAALRPKLQQCSQAGDTLRTGP